MDGVKTLMLPAAETQPHKLKSVSEAPSAAWGPRKNVLVGLARSNHLKRDRQNIELRCRSAAGAIHESRSRSSAGAAITAINQDLGRNAFLDLNRT
jgi:hypothetical protein